jgi:hypothetical protein
MDLYQLVYWLVIAGVLVALPMLANRWPVAELRSAPVLNRLGVWASDQSTPTAEFDQLAEDLSRVLRRERLRADIQRLQHILATDMWMSATRQLGNRLAYQWLVRELERTREPTPAVAALVGADAWSSAATLQQPSSWVCSPDYQGSPTVEVLDIGWSR